MKRLCANCQERSALFRFRGKVRANPQHNLCIKCYRDLINSVRAAVQKERNERLTSAVQQEEPI